MNSLLIVAGHAHYRDGQWIGGYAGEDAFYELHIRRGLQLAAELKFQPVFSGGQTRPDLEHLTLGRSEAEGMFDFAKQNGLVTDGEVILERFSRDSFENVLFSLLAFHQHFRKWPENVAIVSWASKALRFHLIACGLMFGGRIQFHGVGDYPSQTTLERACSAKARFILRMVDASLAPPAYRVIDPMLRHPEFATKRINRMPSRYPKTSAGNAAFMDEVKAALATHSPECAPLLNAIEALTPGEHWRQTPLPWA